MFGRRSRIRPEVKSAAPRNAFQKLEDRVLFAAQSLAEVPDQSTNQDGAAVNLDLNPFFDDPTITGTTVRFQTSLGGYDIELFDSTAPLTVANFLQYIDGGDYVNSFVHRTVSGQGIQGGGFTHPGGTSILDVPSRGELASELASQAKVSGIHADITQGNAVVQLPSGSDLSAVAPGDRIRLLGRTDGENATSFFKIASVDDANDTVTLDQAPAGASGRSATWYIVSPQNVHGTLAMVSANGTSGDITSQFFINAADNQDSRDSLNKGTAVFARVLGSGMSVIDAIAALPTVDLGEANSNLDNLPVRNFNTGASLEDSLVKTSAAGRVNELLFEANVLSGSSLANVSVDAQGMLMVVPNAGASGTVSVEVKVTSRDGGAAVTQTIDVVITPTQDPGGGDTGGGDTGGGDTGGGDTGGGDTGGGTNAQIPADLNGDGLGDLVFRNIRTGEHQVWYMNGVTQTGSDSLPIQTGSRWLLGGVADFDGDGDGDLLFRNNNNTRNRIWIFEGSTFVEKLKLPSFKNPNVIVGGVGDFDGDGDTDIWWRQTQYHNNIVWEMDGVKRVGRGKAANHKVDHRKDASWMPYGVGDLDGDGTDDMVFRQASTGANEAVLIKNRAVSSTSALPNLAGADWFIGGSYDVNTDSKTDIVWRNNSTGANMIWRMNNLVFDAQLNLTSLSDTDWRLPGPGVVS